MNTLTKEDIRRASFDPQASKRLDAHVKERMAADPTLSYRQHLSCVMGEASAGPKPPLPTVAQFRASLLGDHSANRVINTHLQWACKVNPTKTPAVHLQEAKKAAEEEEAKPDPVACRICTCEDFTGDAETCQRETCRHMKSDHGKADEEKKDETKKEPASARARVPQQLPQAARGPRLRALLADLLRQKGGVLTVTPASASRIEAALAETEGLSERTHWRVLSITGSPSETPHMGRHSIEGTLAMLDKDLSPEAA